jgi:hypothetical protein
MTDPQISATRRGDSLRESTAPQTASMVDNSAGLYPTDRWEATYFTVSRQGVLTARRIAVCVPAGLDRVCARVPFGQAGCIYAVRRWGFALRPSALDAAGFDPGLWLVSDDDAELIRLLLQAAAFDLPGEFIIASPEHPFRLVAGDGTLRGSSVEWRTYLGALAFFASGGQVDADLVRFWAEARESYNQAVEVCLAAIRGSSSGEDSEPDLDGQESIKNIVN